MNQAKAQKLSSEGFSLYEAESYLEAEGKYKKAVELAEFSHWSTQDIYGQYSMVLRKLGKKKEALKMLEISVESALKADPNSNGVSIARHFLAEYLIELNESEKALKELLPILEMNVDLKWLLHFSAANAYFHLGDSKNYEKQACKVVITANPARFPDVISVKKQIESNVQKSS